MRSGARFATVSKFGDNHVLYLTLFKFSMAHALFIKLLPLYQRKFYFAQIKQRDKVVERLNTFERRTE